ncbi:MAG: cupin domain-containing protein [Chloroflexi bacterium]|nr:cupin domain-containing protein [Chloroflexota bacterium]
MGRDLKLELEAHAGRHELKAWDWDAFPANRGFPELARAQMRYIGAGGSPKHDDPTTLPAEHFTLSLIWQEPGRSAAMHRHEIEEAFLVLEGVLTVTWDYDGRHADMRLGPRDMVLNPPGRPHGFRNDGVEPVLMSIMVGSPRPLAPIYTGHPKDAVSIRGEAATDDDLADFKRHVRRYRDAVPEWLAAGFARLPYLGAGGVMPGHYRDDVIHLPAGRGVAAYTRDVEDAYFVLQGCLTVGWEREGQRVETRLGPKDLLLTPAAQAHWFRNEGVQDVELEMVVGTPEPETVEFQPA